MEYEFISCLTIWHHLHSNMSITFGIGGLIVRHNMFSVPVTFFFPSVAN